MSSNWSIPILGMSMEKTKSVDVALSKIMITVTWCIITTECYGVCIITAECYGSV
jgi:hypothetical protein